MERRVAFAVVLGILLLGPAGRAQPARKARIGFLTEAPNDLAVQRGFVEPFRQGLRELGHVEGQNLSLEFRWAEGKYERLPALAAELLRLDLDVLVAAFPAAARAAKNATRTVPIVAIADNPVEEGLAAGLARPGGNVTGLSSWGIELVSKRLQLLKDLVPAGRRFAVLANPVALGGIGTLETTLRKFGPSLGVEIKLVQARGPDDFEGVFAALARDRVDGLVVLADVNTYTHRARLNELCLQRRMPSVWGGRDFLTGGALASYQSDWPALFRGAAVLVDKILKGAKPGEIPFERASKLELIVDLRAARALGTTVPQSLLLAADEVIE